jgi:ABC-type uncharacterized transport system substrate-binding protein
MAPILVGLMRAVRPELRRVVAIVAGAGQVPREGWSRVLGALGEESARIGLKWEVLPVPSLPAFEKAIAGMDARMSALYLMGIPEDGDPARFVEALTRRKLASLTASAGPARMGALMHYSVNHADPMARVAALIDKLLRGANPAETPFELPDRTTFIVNRATAKAIGLDLPAEILARATEIID